MAPRMTGEWTLIDAVAMNRDNPVSFSLPASRDMAGLKAGSMVKIGVNFTPDNGLLNRATPVGRLEWSALIGDEQASKTSGERFWVLLTAVAGDRLIGTIDNDLAYTHRHGLSCGSEIQFERRHVLNVYIEAN